MTTDSDTVEPPSINEGKINSLLAEKMARQNMPMAVIAGAVSAIIGAVIWAAITVITEYQIGWMAIGVGFMVGFAVRVLGKGMHNVFGYVGAVFALLGCLIGNLLSVVGFISIMEEVRFLEVLTSLDIAMVIDIMVVTFSPIDLLFYGLAVFAGYKYSFVQITDAEIDQLSAQETA